MCGCAGSRRTRAAGQRSTSRDTHGHRGGRLAGWLSTARALREQGFSGRLVVVGAEELLPHDRPPLSKEFLAGKVGAEELRLTDSADEPPNVDWRLGRTAVALAPAERAVELDDGQRRSATR